jgi:hypothetical protein
MFQIIDTKTNEVLGTYSSRNSAYRAINRGLNTRFSGRCVSVVAA